MPCRWYDVAMPKDQKPNYAFIDSQNLNLGIQKAGFKMDWKKFRAYLTESHGVDKAFMFIGYVPEFEPMYEQLHEAGYMIVLKPTFDMTRPQPEMQDPASQPAKSKKEESEHTTKGNVDADLVLWAMKEMSNYRKAVIVSGDGDFYSLVEYLAGKNRLAKLLTPNDKYSSLYNKYDSFVVRLDKLRGQLAYRDKPRRSRKH